MKDDKEQKKEQHAKLSCMGLKSRNEAEKKGLNHLCDKITEETRSWKTS